MSFTGIIGTLMEGSGLDSALANIYGRVSVRGVLSGKAIAVFIRGYCLLKQHSGLKPCLVLYNLQIISVVSAFCLLSMRVIHTTFLTKLQHRLSFCCFFSLLMHMFV